MTSREFCYWLQGMFELNGLAVLDETRTRMIKNHLDLVFIHEIDPSYPNGEKLQAVHDSKPYFAKPIHSKEEPPVMRC